MSRRLLLAVLSALAGASGCSVNEAEEVATYRTVLDDGVREDAVPRKDDSPAGVAESMLLASLRNERLGLEGEAYLQAIIGRRRAVAAFLPTITLAPTYEAQKDTGTNVPNALDLPVIGALAFNPVRDTAALSAAAATEEERRALLLDAQDALLIDVARTHYEVIRAERAARVLESSLRVQEARVQDAEGRLEAGFIRPLDVSLSRAQAARTAADRVTAQTRVRTARSLLEFLTATPYSGRAVLDSLDVPEALAPLADLWAEAERRREDILAAGHRIDAAAETVESAYGQYYPSITLDLQAFLRRRSEPADVDWFSILQARIPLFSAGIIEADVRDALSRLRQARLAESLTRRAARRDVEIAVRNYEGAVERGTQLRVEVASAREALDQAEGLYQAGLATNLERLTAQDQVLSAELRLVNAELDRKLFYLDLRRATGALHELLGLRRRQGNPDAKAR